MTLYPYDMAGCGRKFAACQDLDHVRNAGMAGAVFCQMPVHLEQSVPCVCLVAFREALPPADLKRWAPYQDMIMHIVFKHALKLW